MGRFVDPRTHPFPAADQPAAPTTDDPESLDDLHALCKHGRLYDIERWIADGRPLQLSSDAAAARRRRTTALDIALKQQNHALVLLLLCNGYDPTVEPRVALNTALSLRRADIVELLLARGADPHRVDLHTLFNTYETALFDRFYDLGVDFTADHELARALGYHTSNKPLFGFTKRRQETDPGIHRDLNMALGRHAAFGNEKGALLCLWAGADPHAAVPGLPLFEDYPSEIYEEETETALQAACSGGHASLLERFGPDPERDDFEALYQVARNPETIELLARWALPTDVTAVVLSLIESAAWSWDLRHDSAGALRRLFELGARWTDAPKEVVGAIRRSLLRSRAFTSIVLVLATDDYCSPEIRRELARTPAFKNRLQERRLVPKPGDRGWRRRHDAEEMEAIIIAFDLDIPLPYEKRLLK